MAARRGSKFGPNGPHATDLGNAARFAHDHQSRVRFCPGLGWLAFNGTRWVQSDVLVERLALHTVQGIPLEAIQEPDDERRRALQKWALQSESSGRVRAMIELARSDQRLEAAAGDFDSNPWLLGCPWGAVDLRTGEPRDPDATDMITKQTGCDYEPDAEAPRFMEFLDWVTMGRADLAAYLQRLAGYVLTGVTNERAFFIWYGVGMNGKSVFAELLRAMLGDYATVLPVKTLLAKRGEGGASPELAKLRAARLATAAETSDSARLDVSLVKNLTGNERITARELYKSYVDFDPTFKVILSTNHRPAVPGDDQAIWDRMHLVPFDNRVASKADEDRDLSVKLREELPGILAWAVEGCLAWQEHGLNPPEAIRAAGVAYRASMDDVGRFLDACTVREEGARVGSAQLHAAYQRWARGEGIEHPLGIKKFGQRVAARLGADTRKPLHGVSTWTGLAIIDGRLARTKGGAR